MSVDLSPPASLEEARKRREVLVAQKLELCTLLANKNRVDHRGRRISDREYHAWRAQVVGHLGQIELGLAKLKTAIREFEEQRAREKTGVDPRSGRGLLEALLGITLRYAVVELLDEKELALISQVRTFLGKADAEAPF